MFYNKEISLTWIFHEVCNSILHKGQCQNSTKLIILIRFHVERACCYDHDDDENVSVKLQINRYSIICFLLAFYGIVTLFFVNYMVDITFQG